MRTVTYAHIERISFKILKSLGVFILSNAVLY